MGIKKRFTTHSRKFPLFAMVGMVKTVTLVFLSWLLIDKIQIHSLIASTISNILVFFMTYLLYVFFKIIEPTFKKFTSATIFFNVANAILIWVFVDFFGFSGVVGSTIVLSLLFILRYVFFSKIGLIKHS